jgi:hypothetical protein
MTDLSGRNAFFKEIANLRHQGRVEPVELARRALKAGLQPYEALEEIRNYFDHRPAAEDPFYFRSTDLTQALSLFISALCRLNSSDLILEYTSVPILRVAQIAATDVAHQLSFVTSDKQFFEMLRILFAGRGPSVFETVADIPASTTYGSIVCSPPLGLRQPNDKATDGFGGEIVRKLVPFLSEKGTIFWITARGVVFNPRAKQTLTNFSR